jgi:proton glutamate symport protein
MTRSTLRSPTPLAFFALIIGLALGMVYDATKSGALARLIAVLEPVGALWVAAIRMVVIPLVISLVIVGVSGVSKQQDLSRLGRRVFTVFVLTLAITAAVIAAIAPLCYRWLQIDAGAVADLRANAVATSSAPAQASLRDWLLSIVPSNPMRAAVDGAMLPLFIFALAYGFAFRRVSRDSASAVLNLLDGIKHAALTVVSWVLAAAPVGVFALALGLGVRLGASAAGAIGYFILVVCGLHVLVGLALYPVTALLTGVSMRRFAFAAAPAQLVAVTTRTSSAALPALYQGASRLGISSEVAGFVLPLAISAFRLSSPVNWSVGAIFIARLYGIPLDALQIALIALASVVLNPASPAVPSGGLFVQAPVYLAVGLPVEGLGILIAIDAIPDLFKTILNVTGDMAALTIIAPRTSDIVA